MEAIPIRLRTCLACLAFALAAIPAAARSAERLERVDSSPQAARAYWTPQRMRAAVPVEPELAGDAAQTAAVPASAPADPAYVPPAAAGAPAGATIEPGAPLQRGGIRGRAIVRDEVLDPAAPEARAHGKIFFTIPQGPLAGDFVCSGTVVNSFNRRVVWTAGHCVYDLAGGYATNWIFVPGYKDGTAPFGEWPARRLATTTAWQTSANIHYDLGAALVVSNVAGQRLQEVVGARGIGFDQPRDQLFSAFGYPAVAPPIEFTGQREFRCLSSSAGTDQPLGAGPPTMAIDCDMGAGASGGGWIAGNTLLSVTSYGYVGNTDRLYGPYLSAGAKELYKSVRGNKPKKKHHGPKRP
ncbi:MAG: hypothetical protein ABIZ50_08405 [Solirubrobacterales bacterium]